MARKRTWLLAFCAVQLLGYVLPWAGTRPGREGLFWTSFAGYLLLLPGFELAIQLDYHLGFNRLPIYPTAIACNAVVWVACFAAVAVWRKLLGKYLPTPEAAEKWRKAKLLLGAGLMVLIIAWMIFLIISNRAPGPAKPVGQIDYPLAKHIGKSWITLRRHLSANWLSGRGKEGKQ